jgi:predicted Rossmann fold nucleotide-binding protein DprA/Smf involved in DNA uptake
MLLSNGAMLATKSEDILTGLGLELAAELKSPIEMDRDTVSKSNNLLVANHLQLEKSSKKYGEHTLENCTDIERKILRALAIEPMSRANLLQKIGGNVVDTTVALSLLEMKKFVVDSGGILRRN